MKIRILIEVDANLQPHLTIQCPPGERVALGQVLDLFEDARTALLRLPAPVTHAVEPAPEEKP